MPRAAGAIMSKDLAASDENLIQKSDDDEAKVSFFDNTIDESENDLAVEAPKTDKEPDSATPFNPPAGRSDDGESALSKANKSLMEIEVTRDKLRWMYMSELGAIFGEEKHTREGFVKVFGTRVSD